MLKIEGLNQFYGGSHTLRDVTLELALGEVTTLLGRNGMGKTTLLKCLMGLLPVRSGRIEFDAEAAATCLAYVESRGCDRAYTYTPSEEEVAGRKACASVFRGTMTRNGPCLLSMECAHEEGETALCGIDFTNCTDACCVGGCRVLIPGKTGEACNNTTGCQPGSYCASDPMTGNPTVCTAAIASARQAANQRRSSPSTCPCSRTCWCSDSPGT